MSETNSVDRRTVLAALSAGIAAFWAMAVTMVTGVYAASPLFSARRQREVPLGRLDALKTGFTGVDVKDRTNDGWYSHEEPLRVYARLDDAGEPVVISGRCTHLGCTVQWDGSAQVFRCPCHGGVYAADGSVQSGPPPKPLQTLRANVRDGEVFARLS